MVKIGLQIRATLENVASFGAHEDIVWCLKLKCISCGAETSTWQTVEATAKAAMKESRGNANLVIKCKVCSRENSIDVLNDSLTSYTVDDSLVYKTIVAFDCRGVEPIALDARGGFFAVAINSGLKFSDIELQENEWGDYDEKDKQAVGVYELEHKFVKLEN